MMTLRKGCVLLLAVSASAQIPLVNAYADGKTGLLVHFPAGWRIDRGGAAISIVTFDPGKRPRQFLVPLNGAEIALSGPPRGVSTISDWTYFNRIQSHALEITQVDIPTRYFGPVRATRARIQFADDVIPQGVMILYFFELDGHLLKASLLYRGQARAEYFEGVLDEVFKNLEWASPP